MYVAGAEHANREPARRVLAQVRKGKLDAGTSTGAWQEILYRYAAIGRRDLAHEVYDLFVEICPVVLGVTLAETDRARDILCQTTGISARDAIHAAVMLNHRSEEHTSELQSPC